MDVLLGLVGGEESTRALRETVARTRETGDELTVAIVERPEVDVAPRETHEQARRAIADAGIDATVTTLEGDPGSALVTEAERGGYDLLVIGGGTQSPMGKIRLGPVTEFLLLNATTSVKLVR